MNWRVIVASVLVLVGGDFSICAEARAAAVLNGVVLRDQMGGQPVVGVSVAPLGKIANAVIVEAKDHGKFSLVFPKKEAGDVVTLQVTKSGLVVVNDVQLLVTLPKDPDAQVLVILMSKEAEREQWARAFYRLKGFEAAEQTYKRKVEELESGQQLDSKTMAQLRAKLEQARAQVDRFAQELAARKPEELSDLYQKALREFLQGPDHFDKALAVLNEAELQRRVQLARKEQAEAQRKLEEAASSYRLKGQMLVLRFRFDEAARAYKEAINATPESFDAQFDYAYFAQSLNRFGPARDAYERALAIAQWLKDQNRVAMTLNNLGNLHRVQNRPDEARAAYGEALKTYRALAATNPETYLPYVATTLNNLGILHRVQNRPDEARAAYKEALGIYERFAVIDLAQYGGDVRRVRALLGEISKQW